MPNAFKQTMCAIMCASLMASACATAGSGHSAMYVGQPGNAGRSVLVDYMQRLPPGTLVRVNRAQGHSVRGTLMKATDQSVFVQPKTRLPEAIVEIPVNDIVTVTPETSGSGVGRAIGIGVAAGAAATIGILLILIAVASD
jgi:hypothetical protein